MISDSIRNMNVPGKRDLVMLAGGALLVAALAAAVYAQTLDFEFLNLDDNWYITLDTNVHKGLTTETAAWAFTTFHSPYYMPVTRLSFLADASLYGIDPAGFHLTNLVLHAANAVLVLLLIWLLSRRPVVGLLTALVFAVHPQHIEAFVWVSERKEVLSALFGLLSLIGYVLYASGRRDDPGRSPGSGAPYLASVLCFMLSMLAKPAWVTLPALLLLLDWWPLRRLDRRALRPLLAEKVPYILVAGAVSALILYSAASTVDHVTNTAQSLPLWQRTLNAGVIYVTYLYYTFVPVDVPVYFPYPRDALPAWWIAGSCALLIVVTLACLHARRRIPQLLMGWLWFLGTLFPMVGIISAGESVFIGNRWTYLPHIGLFAGLAWFVAAWCDRHAGLKTGAGLAAVMLVAALSWSSLHQAGHWRDTESFWRQAIRTVNDNDMAYYMLGTHYLNQGDAARARAELEKAYRLNPEDAFYALMLGNAHARLGDTVKAMEYYRRIVETGPPNISLLVEMGLKSLAENRPRLALDFFRAAVDSKVARPHHRLPRHLALLYAGYAAAVTDSVSLSRNYLQRFLDEGGAPRAESCTVAGQELHRITRGAVDTRAWMILERLCPGGDDGD